MKKKPYTVISVTQYLCEELKRLEVILKLRRPPAKSRKRLILAFKSIIRILQAKP